MQKYVKALLASFFCLVFIISLAFATEESEKKALSQGTKVSGQWFISYSNGKENKIPTNRFVIDRGYIIIEKALSNKISGRITPDVSVDREGDGEGDLEMRLKYCYIDYKFENTGFLTDPHVEFGLVHRPWISFEEHINNYRMQGTAYLERNDIFNSGDFGFTYAALLGGEMSEDYKQQVNSKFPGRYGSVAFGFYNGGGYHAIEQNNNKTFEARITVRPLPAIIPGFQVSYHSITGKGNTKESPDWNLNTVFVSYDHRRYGFTGMIHSGIGNFKGKMLDSSGDSLDHSGYSFFGELKFPDQKVSLIGRYDFFDDNPNSDGNNSKRIITGVAYRIYGKTRALLDYDINTRDTWENYTDALTQFTIEYNF
ncbi:MAG: hypothetical protein JXB48_09405 [Candidatus Latescibacteria bacterium]|nr:hypothetical protein [Candidatus Latescibacterota bacterium]